MPVVTKLTQQKNNPHRFNLFIDDEFYCGVDEELLITFGLAKGVEFTPERLQEIFNKSELNKLFMRSLDFLSIRPRSIREVRDYLYKKLGKYDLGDTEADPELAARSLDSIIARLENLNYVNDYDFAVWWIEQRTESVSPKGKMAVLAELAKKGVNRDIIDKAWSEKGVDELEGIKAQFNKVKGRYDVEDPKGKQKLIRYLQNKGFRWEHIQTVLK